MSQSTTLQWNIPDDVQSFAAEQGVAAFLPAVLEATQRIFPMARRQSVLVEVDPEIANDRHIVLAVELPLDHYERRSRRKWHEAILQCCPAPMVCVFRLGIDLVK